MNALLIEVVTSPTCKPCKNLLAILKEVQTELEKENLHITIREVGMEDIPDQVSSVPTTFILTNEPPEIVDIFAGVKTKTEIVEMLKDIFYTLN